MSGPAFGSTGLSCGCQPQFWPWLPNAALSGRGERRKPRAAAARSSTLDCGAHSRSFLALDQEASADYGPTEASRGIHRYDGPVIAALSDDFVALRPAELAGFFVAHAP